MKAIVLNLERRSDRRILFDKTNGDRLEYTYSDRMVDGKDLKYSELTEFDTNKRWRDPILKSHLTKGEVGCFISHWNVWRKCVELNEPVIVLEDDAILTDQFSLNEIQQQLDKGFNFLYLGWREMEESIEFDGQFVIPVYPYWGLAYVVTPESAAILLNKEIQQNIIPVDEYLPLMMIELKPLAYKNNVVHTRDRSETGTDITSGSRYDAFIDFNVHALTVGTDEKKCSKLYASGDAQGVEFINLGSSVNWEGGDMTIRGGGQKIRMVREYIENLPPDDVIFFCDAYDVFLADTMNEMIYRYLEIGTKVLFGAERVCWPNDKLASFMEALNKRKDTPYQYLNSGTFLGRVSELRRIFSTPIQDNESDQLWMQYRWIEGKYDIALDTECYLFQTHEPKVYKHENGQLLNPITNCFTCLYHGNGGVREKEIFNEKFSEFYGSSSPIVHIPTHDYEIIDDHIILIDYLTPSMCDSMIELSERSGGYKSLEGDDVPGHELRLKELGLWSTTSEHWMNVVRKVVSQYWEYAGIHSLRDAFLIKYTMEGQKELRLHSDISLVTGSVKLNDEYEGGELYFPRQKFSNQDVPVGKCILFPGQVTHPHTSQRLKSGTKYSLTIWTNGSAFK